MNDCRICGLPESGHRHSGRYGWYLLALFVLLWDICAPETLSAAFLRRRAHPAVIIGWAALTAHLYGFLPRKVDPIIRFGDFLQGVRK